MNDNELTIFGSQSYTEDSQSSIAVIIVDFEIVSTSSVAPLIIDYSITSNGVSNVTQGTTSCNVNCSTIFSQLYAEVVSIGGTRVSWDLIEGIPDTGPFVATLQWSPSGNPSNLDWENCGPPSRDPKYLYDPQQRVWGNWNFLLYRVALESEATGDTYYSNPLKIDGKLPVHEALQANEIIRKEKLRLKTTTAGVYGYLLQERRYGTLCECVDPITKEQTNSSCPICFGRQFVGGYHPPIPCWMTDPSLEDLRKFRDQRGQNTDSMRIFRMSAEYPVATNDVWVNHYSDERYRVDTVKELASMRDLPLIWGVIMNKLPRTDIAYYVPVVKVTPKDTLAPDRMCVITSY